MLLLQFVTGSWCWEKIQLSETWVSWWRCFVSEWRFNIQISFCIKNVKNSIKRVTSMCNTQFHLHYTFVLTQTHTVLFKTAGYDAKVNCSGFPIGKKLMQYVTLLHKLYNNTYTQSQIYNKLYWFKYYSYILFNNRQWNLVFSTIRNIHFVSNNNEIY